MPRIVVTRSIPEPALELLRTAGEVHEFGAERAMTPDELREAVHGADAVVTAIPDRIDDAVAEAAGPQLKVVSTIAVGYDNLDVGALTARGVEVTNTPGVLVEATADIAWGLLLSVTRRLGEGERLLRAREPWAFSLSFMLGTGMQGKTLGVVGLGQIGQAVARRGRAFGMEIAYTGRRRVGEDVESELDARFMELPDLLESADVVSLHCPLTSETRHLIDDAALRRMRSTAFLVNTSRGPVVDEDALAKALERDEIAGAALDVFEDEPRVHSGLLDRDDVALAPHLGSATVETRTEMARLAARNVVGVLGGDGPVTSVR